MIASEETIMAWVANAHEEGSAAHQRYSKYLPHYPDSDDGDDEYSQYSPHGF